MSTDDALSTQVSDDADQPDQTANIARRRHAVRGELLPLQTGQPGAICHAARREVTSELLESDLTQTLQQAVGALSHRLRPTHLPPANYTT